MGLPILKIGIGVLVIGGGVICAGQNGVDRNPGICTVAAVTVR
ncbi:MAG: hypothetical protein U0401_07775 [Anaerolineae bacterium]